MFWRGLSAWLVLSKGSIIQNVNNNYICKHFEQDCSEICFSGEPSVLLAGKQHGMIIAPNGPLVFSRGKKMGNLMALELILKSMWVRGCKVISVESDSMTPWTIACQAPLSIGFSRQEYWSGLPCPPPGDLPKAGTEPVSLNCLPGGFFTTSAT